MAKQFEKLSERLQTFISEQHLFFVGTAMDEGKINVSPKGMDALRIIDPKRVVWLNLTGSGNETAAHLLQSKRMTIMFCAFEGAPLILRLYGSATAYHQRDAAYAEYISLFPPMDAPRQIVVMEIDMAQTSCGFGVPIMEFKEDRTMLAEWAQRKGPEGIKDYWEQKNKLSLDGHPTNIFED